MTQITKLTFLTYPAPGGGGGRLDAPLRLFANSRKTAARSATVFGKPVDTFSVISSKLLNCSNFLKYAHTKMTEGQTKQVKGQNKLLSLLVATIAIWC